jgi:hypothetical protein
LGIGKGRILPFLCCVRSFSFCGLRNFRRLSAEDPGPHGTGRARKGIFDGNFVCGVVHVKEVLLLLVGLCCKAKYYFVSI